MLTFVVGIVGIALQFAFNIQTRIAGVLAMGMAGGLVIGGEIARDAKQ